MPADFRALTLTPEWAWAVTHLDKRVENRTWPAPTHIIGQRIAIHAGKADPDWNTVSVMARCAGWSVDLIAGQFFAPGSDAPVVRPAKLYGTQHRLTRGAIVATAVVSGCRAVDPRDAVGWEAGPWCWDLTELRVLPAPVPCKGALGLWRVPAELAEEVLRG